MGLGVFNCETKHALNQGGRREQRASAWVFKGPGTAKGAVNPFSRVTGQGNGPQHDANMHVETERSPRLQRFFKSPRNMTQVTVSLNSSASDGVHCGQQVISILEQQQQQQDGLLGRSRLCSEDDGPVLRREGPGLARHGSIDNNKEHAPSVRLFASRVGPHVQGRDTCEPGILGDLLSPRARSSRHDDDDDADDTGDAVGHSISVMEALTEEQEMEAGPRMALRRPVSVMDALLDDKFSGPSQVGRSRHEPRADTSSELCLSQCNAA